MMVLMLPLFDTSLNLSNSILPTCQLSITKIKISMIQSLIGVSIHCTMGTRGTLRSSIITSSSCNQSCICLIIMPSMSISCCMLWRVANHASFVGNCMGSGNGRRLLRNIKTNLATTIVSSLNCCVTVRCWSVCRSLLVGSLSVCKAKSWTASNCWEIRATQPTSPISGCCCRGVVNVRSMFSNSKMRRPKSVPMSV